MASNAEMFQFVSTFGPMLGEIAARQDFLEQRIAALEEGGARGAPGGDDEPPSPDDEIDFMGQKISMKGMLEGAMPKGGMSGLMDSLAKWKPKGGETAAAPATPPAAAPAPETPKPT